MNSKNFCLSLASILAELVTWRGEHTEPGKLSFHVLVSRITAAPPHPPPNAVPPGPHAQSPEAGATTPSTALKIKSHNLNKHKPESFLHSDLHEQWDILFYQEITSEPLLPFGWHSEHTSAKFYSSLGEGGAEGACIAVTDTLAPFVTLYKSPCPGALCTAIMHLPGFKPILLVSVYAQPPLRTELERAMNRLFQQFPLWIAGGDFNAQLSSLDTNGKTTNRWNWLTALVDDKKEAIDTFRTLHQDTIAYTRYKNQLLPCDTRIELILLSQPLISTPSLSLTGASIIQHDVTSDHHPISATVSLPFTPAHPTPEPRTLFRRLTQPEEVEFHKTIQPLHQWASQMIQHEVSPDLLVQYINTLVPQIGTAFHQITRPQLAHRETSIEREFKSILNRMPKGQAARTQALKRSQSISEKWRDKQRKKEKKKLHYAMVKGSKIKRAIDKALHPVPSTGIQLRNASCDPPRLETDPRVMGSMFSECLEHLGGDPDFQVHASTLRGFIHNLPKCSPEVADAPLDLPDLQWLQRITQRAQPSRATGEDEINYYIVSLLSPELQTLLLQAVHHILLHGPPPEWSTARVCLLFKKGDPHLPGNYRPICLIQTLVKLAAVWQCAQLTDLTHRHSLLHKCQHGGLKHHRCGDHIYDVVSRMLLSKGRLYHLYIDFKKAFNSVPLDALWATLPGYGLPTTLVSSIKRMYQHAVDQPMVNGTTTAGHAQKRGVRQGCPLSPLLFILYLNLMFFHLDQTMDWDLEKTIHAFVDDILVRARSIQDIKTVYEAFDGPARELGLDMNLRKTELHVLRGSGHTVVRSRYGGVLSTRKEDGSPHEVYKYLGVYFYTNNHAHQVLQYIKATINAFYTQLAPLSLTASELIMLTNKQLIPTLAYRLLAGPVTSEHHPLTFLFLLALTFPLPSPFPSLGLSLCRPPCPSASPHSFPSLSLGRLCQRSPRTCPVSLLCVESTQRKANGHSSWSGTDHHHLSSAWRNYGFENA